MHSKYSLRLAPILALIVSIALLIPGITQPLMSLQADMNRQALVAEGQKLLNSQQLHPAVVSMANQFMGSLKVEGQSRVYDKTRSILGTAQDLWDYGFKFVAVLILTFSVVIPVLKLLLLLYAAKSPYSSTNIKINAVLSKWSMADVFAIGVLIAMLAANAASSESALINFKAELHSGFYWFVAFCLVSNIAGQQLLTHLPARTPEAQEHQSKS